MKGSPQYPPMRIPTRRVAKAVPAKAKVSLSRGKNLGWREKGRSREGASKRRRTRVSNPSRRWAWASTARWKCSFSTRSSCLSSMFNPSFLFEQVLQFFFGAVQAGLDGAFGDPQHHSDVLIIQICVKAQHQR